MMKKIFFMALALLPIVLSCRKGSDCIVAAVVWPSCHVDSLAQAKFWSEGIGEWEMVQKGDPRFEGHYQPKRPLWGYEMDNDPAVVEKWIETATAGGVNTFIYDWYWYDDFPYLESALNDGFLCARNNTKMKFSIMWANHDVPGKMWNYHRYGPDCDSLVFKGAVTPKQFEKLVDRWISKYFTRDNYLKIDNRPVFWIYQATPLLESFGGSIERTAEAMQYLDAKCREAGFDGVHLQLSAKTRLRGVLSDEDIPDIAAYDSLAHRLGVRNYMTYTMTGLRDGDYKIYGDNSIHNREFLAAHSDIPVIPTVSLGWDNTPRYPRKGEESIAGKNRNTANFKALLEAAKSYMDSHPTQPRMIVLNAWNEWIEGAYLLPDEVDGLSYLETVREVFDMGSCREATEGR